MTWEAAGAIGEIVSALAVLATLIYLSIQLGRLRTDSISQHVNSIEEAEHRGRLLAVEHMELLDRANRGAPVSDVEQMILREIYLTHQSAQLFAYIRSKNLGNDGDIPVTNLAYTLETYPCLVPHFKDSRMHTRSGPGGQFAKRVSEKMSLQ